MIEEQALVTRVGHGQVWIKSLQSSACGSCVQQTSCGVATLSKLLPAREFALDCDLSLQAGDRVQVKIDAAHLLFSSLLLYMLPLIAMFAAAGAASVLLPQAFGDAWLPEISLAVLLLSFGAIHHFQELLLLHLCIKLQIIGKL